MSAEPAETKPVQYLSFFISGEEYAVSLLEVRELIEHQPVTKVPSMPPFVRGVTNLRGSVVPVVDLATRFGFGETPITKWTCIVMVEVVLEGEKSIVGILADSVRQVVELLPRDIEPPPTFGTRASSRFLRGLGRVENRFVLLLAVDQLFSAEDLTVQAAPEEAPAAPSPDTEPEAQSSP